MVDIVLDTNVLYAAVLDKHGVNRRCIKLLSENLKDFRLCFSSQMFDEYTDIFKNPIISARGVTRQVERLLSWISKSGEEIVPKYMPAIVYPDEKDRRFLEAAVYADAILITNNLKHYPFLGVRIMGPESFLAWCETKGIHESF